MVAEAGSRHGGTAAGRVIVDGLDLTVTRGSVTALVGASGSGKSLSCAAILGVLPPGVRREAGVVALDGVPRSADELRGGLVSMILQNPRTAFNPVMTMEAHCRETVRAHRKGWGAERPHLLALMEEVGLEEPVETLRLHPFEMSGGMLQRMMIALALLSGAPFLIADEPTTDLDPVVQANLLDLIERVVARNRIGLLLITHDLGVVARLADEVTVIDHGRVIERAPVVRLFDAPRHPVVRTLVGAHLDLHEETTR